MPSEDGAGRIMGAVSHRKRVVLDGTLIDRHDSGLEDPLCVMLLAYVRYGFVRILQLEEGP